MAKWVYTGNLKGPQGAKEQQAHKDQLEQLGQPEQQDRKGTRDRQARQVLRVQQEK